MSVSLTSNFFAKARGLTFKDSAQVVWSLNKNTNELTATAAGALGGTVTSVALSDGSSTPIYTISGSPITGAGTLTFTLSAQAKNLVFAGPTTGANAQPTFRGLVVADLPTGIPNANLQNSSLTVTAGTGLSGGGAVSLGGSVTLSLSNPVAVNLGGTGLASYTIGDILYASAATTLASLADVAVGSYLRSGGVATAPVWSTTTVPNDSVLGDLWYGSAAHIISALAGNTTSTKKFLTQTGTGTVSAAPAWGTIAAGDLPANGANPTALVGTAAVNGSATTWMRSDGAPAIDQTMSPTMSGTWTFTTNTTTFKAVKIGTPANPAGFLDIGAGNPLIRVQDSGANGAIMEFYATNTAVGISSNWGTASVAVSFRRSGSAGSEWFGLNAAGTALTWGAGLTNPTYTFTGTGTFTVAGASLFNTSALVNGNATGGIGYGTGAGGTVTQLTSRTTGVTLNKICGAITMFSAAGSATAATFTVTNSQVAATDTIVLNQKSGTNLYNFIVTAVAAGSFNITFFTTGGTATDAPVVNFAVIKAVTA